MREELIINLIALVVISLIVNSIISKIKNWNRKRRERRSLSNTAPDESNLFYISSDRTITTTPPPLPTRSSQQSIHIVQSHSDVVGFPPALPHRQTRMNTNIEDYPRCPIHKCCNRRGDEQKIFYDSNRKMWRCYRGHSFSS